MRSYRAFHHDLNEGAKWAFLKNAFDWVKKRIISFVKKLGFGQTARIPLSPPNLVIEDYLMCDDLLEEGVNCQGGPVQPILGIYGEWLTAMHCYKLFDKINAKRHTFNFDRTEMKKCQNEIDRRKKGIIAIIDNYEKPNWNGDFTYIDGKGREKTKNAFRDYPKGCYQKYFDSIKKHWMEYDAKTKLGAEGIVKVLLEHMEDHEISTFRFDMTGAGGGKGDEGTSDLIIEKMDKDKVVDKIRISLKTLMDGIDSSLGTTLRGWFQALCYVGDIETKNVAQSYWYDPDFLSMLSKKFDKEMADFVKMMSDLDREVIVHIPSHKLVSSGDRIPEDKWDDPQAVVDWYKKYASPEFKMYGPPTSFKTVNEAIDKFPEIFEKKQDKDGKITVKATANMRKDYIRKVFGVGLNSQGALAWAKITEKIMSDPANKRKLIDYVLNKMEVGKETYLVVSGTKTVTDKKTKIKTRFPVVEVKRPSEGLKEAVEKEKDNIDFRVRVDMKNAEKFRDFKPSKSTAGKLFEYLDANTPQDYGGFYWELQIPGQPLISWKWNMGAHATGTAQLKVKAGKIQDSISINDELISDVMKKFGVTVNLD